MSNSLTNVTPQILAKAVSVLRQKAVMPRLINTDYSDEAKKKGSTIDIPIANESTVRDVVAGATFNTSNLTDISPTLKQISLNKWKEVAMVLTEKEEAELMMGYMPERAIESAVAALAEQVNSDIFGLYTGVYGFAGAVGTTPFASNLSEATAARKVLNNQKAPADMRRLVLDPDAEANALNLTQFTDASAAGDAGIIREAIIGRKLGFDWYMDQQVPTHVHGTLSNGSGHLAKINNASVAVGDESCPMDETTLTGTVKIGDVFTVAGDSQTYVVTANATASGNAITVAFSPAAKVAWADNAVVTFKGAAGASETVNLAFHRDAFALASRPLLVPDNMGVVSEYFVDPVTGLVIRFTAQYLHKQMAYSFDILYGVSLIRPELACRLAG